MDDQGGARMDLEPAREVAERAGDLVTGHVREVIDNAQARADDLRSDTVKEVEGLRADAHTASERALGALDESGARLQSLVNELKAAADGVKPS